MKRFGTKIFLFLTLTCLLLLPACDSTDQVEIIDGASLFAIDGPYEGSAFAILSVNDDIYAGGNEGVFHFDSDLDYWTKSLDITTSITVLAISESDILYAGGNKDLWQSSNYGNTWNQILTAANGGFEAINAIQILENGNVLIATENGGILRSENGQTNWQANLTGLDQTNFNALAKDNLDILYAAGGNNVYRSSNGGVTWISVSQNTFSSQVNIKSLITDDLGNLFAGTEASGVYKMLAGGVTWNQVGSINGANRLIKNGENIYAGGNENLYRLNDSRDDWNSINLPNQQGNFQAFTFDQDNNLLAGTNNTGVWKNESNWKNIGLPVQDIKTIIDHETGIYLSSNNAVYLSVDEGDSWEKIYTESPNVILPDDDGNWLTAPTAGGLLFSEPGKTWTSVFNDIEIVSLAGQNQNRWAISESNLYQSQDKSQTWATLTAPSNQMTLIKTDDQNNLFILAEGGVFYQGNSDSTWTNKLAQSNLSTLTLLDENTWLAGGENGFFVTNDAGQTWQQNERNKKVKSIVKRQNNVVLILLYDSLLRQHTLLQSVDETATWQEISIDFPSADELILAGQEEVWIGTRQNGLFKVEFD